MAAGFDWDRLVGYGKNRRLSDVPYSVRVDLNSGKVILLAGNDLDSPEVQLEFTPEAAKNLGEKLFEAHHILAE